MLGFYNYTVVLTYLSLCSGITGIYLYSCRQGHPGLATVCLLISGLLDAFDGKVARTRTQSTDQEKRFGIQIDSLCDLVCFGVLPCCIGYASGMRSPLYVPVFCLFVLAALIRLAYFNVTEEDRQKETAERRKITRVFLLHQYRLSCRYFSYLLLRRSGNIFNLCFWAFFC